RLRRRRTDRPGHPTGCAGPPPTGPGVRPGAGRGVPMRRGLFAVALGVIAAAAMIVPLPLVAIEPGGAVPVPPRVRLGVPAHPVHGQLLLTAVRLSERPALGALAAWIDPTVDLEPRPAIIPPGVPENEYLRAQLLLFQESAKV